MGILEERLYTQPEFSRLCGVSRNTINLRCKDLLKDAMVGYSINLNHPEAYKYLKSKSPQKVEELGLVYHNPSEFQAKSNHLAKKDYVPPKSILNKIEKAKIDTPKVLEKKEAPREVSTYAERAELSSYKKPVASGGRAKLEARKKQSNFTEERLLRIPENIRDFVHMPLGELIENFGTDLAFTDWLKATKSIEDINEKRLKNAQTEGELVNRSLVKKTIIEPMDEMLMKLLSDGTKTIARRSIAMHEAGRTIGEIEEFIKDIMSSFIKPMKSKVARSFKKINEEDS